MKTFWIVTVYDDKGKVAFTETFDSRGKASAYVMRWNRPSNLRWRAEMKKVAA